MLCMQDLLFLKVNFYVVRVGRWDKKQYNPITLSLNDDRCVEKTEIHISTHYNKQSSKVKSKFLRRGSTILKEILKRYFLICKLHIWLVGFKYIATTYQISSFESVFSKDFNSSRVLFCPFMYCFYEKLHSVYGLSTLMYIRLIQFFFGFRP